MARGEEIGVLLVTMVVMLSPVVVAESPGLGAADTETPSGRVATTGTGIVPADDSGSDHISNGHYGSAPATEVDSEQVDDGPDDLPWSRPESGKPFSSSEVSGSSVNGSFEFNNLLGSSGTDITDTVVQTADGGYLLSGRKSSGSGSDAWLIKTDPMGVRNTSVSRTFDMSDLDIANSAIQTEDGGFAIAGRTFQDGDSNPGGFLIKTDSSGAVEFVKTFGGPNTDNVVSVIQTGDGGFVLAGFSEGGDPPSRNGWLIKTDANGTVEFDKTFGGAGHDTFRSVIQTEDGGFALGGTFSSSNDDFWLLKTDASGNVQVNKTYASSINGQGEDESYTVIQTLDGGFALAGWVRPLFTSNYEAWLVKTHANGTEQWNRTYGGSGADLALSVIQTRDGGFALAGDTDTESFGADGTDFWLTKTDRNGFEQWNNTFGGSGFDRAESVVDTRDGSFALTGQTDSFGADGTDGWFVKTKFCVDTTGDGDQDTDGDGLCDNWETDGVDVDADGASELDLHEPPYNADPRHKDIFVEIDYMAAFEPFGEPDRGHRPRQAALRNVTRAFADAPVQNPDGTEGITLHLRVDGPDEADNVPESQQLDHHTFMNYKGGLLTKDFDELKQDNFGDPENDTNATRLARSLTHRYAVFAHQVKTDTTSGLAEDIPGNDFIVSLGSWGDSEVGSVIHQQATFMHELGHALGLRHGGGDDRNCKPNYLSVMSYTRQFPTAINDRPLDYSNQSLPTLDEENLNESLGVQGPPGRKTVYNTSVDGNEKTFVVPANGPIDWDGDNDTDASGLNIDINWVKSESCKGDADFDGNPDGKTDLEGYDDWQNLEYNFRGTQAFAQGVHPTPSSVRERTHKEVYGESSLPHLIVETNVTSIDRNTTTEARINVTSGETDERIENATVNVTGAGVEIANKTTNKNGTVTFLLQPREAGTVNVTAAKIGYLSNRTEILVSEQETCINDAVSGSDDQISLTEIQEAINWWAEGSEIPDTGGETISLSKIQSLINAWAEDTMVSCS